MKRMPKPGIDCVKIIDYLVVYFKELDNVVRGVHSVKKNILHTLKSFEMIQRWTMYEFFAVTKYFKKMNLHRAK